MSGFNSPLDNVRVASPCSSDWNQMVGDERVRFCAQCNLNVYNLSSMKRSEAEALISKTEGRLCVRYFQRRDGTILTNNCPVGLRAIKRRMSRAATATLSAVLSFFAGLGIYAGIASESPPVRSNTMGTVALPVNVQETMDQPVVTVGTTMGRYVEGQAVVGKMPARPKQGTGFKARKAERR
jgi:hypothetical protein